MSYTREIMKNIHYVGYRDWEVRDFHGYKTVKGSTYNAYLIMDEKITLIDTVKMRYGRKLLENISEIVDPAKIDYVVSNHTEPDHSGSMPVVMAAAPKATVIASAKGRDGLENYYRGGWTYQVVKTGDSLDIGARKLEFITTPMLHWPDSMATYLRADKLLFSMDAFGQHYSTSGLYDDEVDECELFTEAKKYYANILMHLGPIAKKTIPAIEALEIEMIAPSHGILWRSKIPEIVARYKEWAECKPSPKVLVVFDTMWESTGRMASAILEGATMNGVEAKLLRLSANELTDVTTEMLDACAVAVGSPTLNNGMMPTVSAFLTYMEGLKPAGKVGAAFGSHGWQGGGAKAVDAALDRIGIAKIGAPITCSFRPDDATLDECRKLGAELARKAAAVK